MGALEFLDPPFDQRAEPGRGGRELLKCLFDVMPFVGIIQVADGPCDLRQLPCSASQKSEGWIALSDYYDDGGISGGTLERPALKRLLRDVEAGLIDVVVRPVPPRAGRGGC